MEQSEQKYLIGRQPILNRDEQICAYELLFRSAQSLAEANVSDASQATASVILNTLAGFGVKQILGKHLGFINLELDILMSDSLELLPKEMIVLELLETLEVTPALIERCRELKEAGFVLALDDHDYDPIYEELYQIIDIVKVDLMATPVDTIGAAVECYRNYQFKLLAEKVETKEEFLKCLDLGFDYFQGYYFAKPAVIEKKKIDEGGAALLKLMRQLMDDAEMEEVEKTFRSSPGLTYKLLLLVNSVSFVGLQKIQTVRHAISMLGRAQIKRWVQLALFATDDSHAMENPLVDMAAVRGGFMEQMATACPRLRGNREAADQAFMTGILSLLESLYDIPMGQIAEELNLSEDVQQALVSREGIYGNLLALAEALEQVDFVKASELLGALSIPYSTVMDAQMKAYNWQAGMG
ncbi:EAL and modified HD-GYP domain-containing signal transduction protein [Trichlorobacter thiogenes]|uniref:EAL and modified HD-GYP domain-containing signal transduction protein n=1 Tax=Trichlorobacter thiogenes TaxID=115783 RepID=A0A1T4MW80_9BACT|nr:EAL domain-containing protein [Trichlorobacter thiogenes]SJZ70898.1 EAL and modified HD-GYP domain-containing signal transduction protein [Trichlorobacter thiogenes]